MLLNSRVSYYKLVGGYSYYSLVLSNAATANIMVSMTMKAYPKSLVLIDSFVSFFLLYSGY